MVGSAQPALLTTRIARAALTELPQKCGAIALAGGSSVEALARVIPAEGEWTVVTNSLPIALLLAVRPNVTLHVVGGRVTGGALATVGESATDFLNDVFVDVAFLGAVAGSPSPEA